MKKSFKLLTAATALLFSFQTVVWSAPEIILSGFSGPEWKPVGREIDIPAEMGQIQTEFISPASIGTVIHIQDAHGNYQAQKNIQRIISHLESTYGARALFLEGANETLRPENMHFFPGDPDADARVADMLVHSGLLTGPELALLERSYGEENEIAGYGIENADTYRKDFELFVSVLKNKEAWQTFIDECESETDKIESIHFSNALHDFVREWRRYRSNHGALQGFIQKLQKQAKESLDLDLKAARAQDEYESLLRILKLQEIEAKLDAKKTELEKSEILKAVKDKISPELYREFEALSPNRSGSTLPRFVLEKLVAAAGDLDFRKFPHFRDWAEYVIFQSEIEPENLFAEIDALTEKIFGALAKTENEKKILALVKDLDLEEKLFSLEISRPELDDIVSRKETLTPEALAGRLRAFSPDFKTTSIEPAARNFDDALKFYDLAKKREDHFFDAVIAGMKDKGITMPILVTGGFHTSGIEEKFREKGLSYVSISPRILEIGKSQEIYLNAMLGRPRISESQIAYGKVITLPREDARALMGDAVLAASLGAVNEAQEIVRRRYVRFDEARLQAVAERIIEILRAEGAAFPTIRSLSEQDGFPSRSTLTRHLDDILTRVSDLLKADADMETAQKERITAIVDRRMAERTARVDAAKLRRETPVTVPAEPEVPVTPAAPAAEPLPPAAPVLKVIADIEQTPAPNRSVGNIFTLAGFVGMIGRIAALIGLVSQAYLSTYNFTDGSRAVETPLTANGQRLYRLEENGDSRLITQDQLNTLIDLRIIGPESAFPDNMVLTYRGEDWSVGKPANGLYRITSLDSGAVDYVSRATLDLYRTKGLLKEESASPVPAARSHIAHLGREILNVEVTNLSHLGRRLVNVVNPAMPGLSAYVTEDELPDWLNVRGITPVRLGYTLAASLGSVRQIAGELHAAGITVQDLNDHVGKTGDDTADPRRTLLEIFSRNGLNLANPRQGHLEKIGNVVMALTRLSAQSLGQEISVPDVLSGNADAINRAVEWFASDAGNLARNRAQLEDINAAAGWNARQFGTQEAMHYANFIQALWNTFLDLSLQRSEARPFFNDVDQIYQLSSRMVRPGVLAEQFAARVNDAITNAARDLTQGTPVEQVTGMLGNVSRQLQEQIDFIEKRILDHRSTPHLTKIELERIQREIVGHRDAFEVFRASVVGPDALQYLAQARPLSPVIGEIQALMNTISESGQIRLNAGNEFRAEASTDAMKFSASRIGTTTFIVSVEFKDASRVTSVSTWPMFRVSWQVDGTTESRYFEIHPYYANQVKKFLDVGRAAEYTLELVNPELRGVLRGASLGQERPAEYVRDVIADAAARGVVEDWGFWSTQTPNDAALQLFVRELTLGPQPAGVGAGDSDPMSEYLSWRGREEALREFRGLQGADAALDALLADALQQVLTTRGLNEKQIDFVDALASLAREISGQSLGKEKPVRIGDTKRPIRNAGDLYFQLAEKGLLDAADADGVINLATLQALPTDQEGVLLYLVAAKIADTRVSAVVQGVVFKGQPLYEPTRVEGSLRSIVPVLFQPAPPREEVPVAAPVETAPPLLDFTPDAPQIRTTPRRSGSNWKQNLIFWAGIFAPTIPTLLIVYFFIIKPNQKPAVPPKAPQQATAPKDTGRPPAKVIPPKTEPKKPAVEAWPKAGVFGVEVPAAFAPNYKDPVTFGDATLNGFYDQLIARIETRVGAKLDPANLEDIRLVAAHFGLTAANDYSPAMQEGDLGYWKDKLAKDGLPIRTFVARAYWDWQIREAADAFGKKLKDAGEKTYWVERAEKELTARSAILEFRTTGTRQPKVEGKSLGQAGSLFQVDGRLLISTNDRILASPEKIAQLQDGEEALLRELQRIHDVRLAGLRGDWAYRLREDASDRDYYDLIVQSLAANTLRAEATTTENLTAALAILEREEARYAKIAYHSPNSTNYILRIPQPDVPEFLSHFEPERLVSVFEVEGPKITRTELTVAEVAAAHAKNGGDITVDRWGRAEYLPQGAGLFTAVDFGYAAGNIKNYTTIPATPYWSQMGPRAASLGVRNLTPAERPKVEAAFRTLESLLAAREKYDAQTATWTALPTEEALLAEGPFDVMMVYGSPDTRVPREAARLAKPLLGLNADMKVLTAGKGGSLHGFSLDPRFAGLPEAEIYKRIMEELGVRVDFTEVESTNSGMNVVKSRDVMDQNKLRPSKVLVLQTPLSQKRTGGSFIAQYPREGEDLQSLGIEKLVVFAPYFRDLSAMNDQELQTVAIEALEEMDRAHSYPELGFMSSFEISADALAAEAYLNSLYRPEAASLGVAKATQKPYGTEDFIGEVTTAPQTAQAQVRRLAAGDPVLTGWLQAIPGIFGQWAPVQIADFRRAFPAAEDNINAIPALTQLGLTGQLELSSSGKQPVYYELRIHYLDPVHGQFQSEGRASRAFAPKLPPATPGQPHILDIYVQDLAGFVHAMLEHVVWMTPRNFVSSQVELRHTLAAMIEGIIGGKQHPVTLTVNDTQSDPWNVLVPNRAAQEFAGMPLNRRHAFLIALPEVLGALDKQFAQDHPSKQYAYAFAYALHDEANNRWLSVKQAQEIHTEIRAIGALLEEFSSALEEIIDAKGTRERIRPSEPIEAGEEADAIAEEIERTIAQQRAALEVLGRVTQTLRGLLAEPAEQKSAARLIAEGIFRDRRLDVFIDDFSYVIIELGNELDRPEDQVPTSGLAGDVRSFDDLRDSFMEFASFNQIYLNNITVSASTSRATSQTYSEIKAEADAQIDYRHEVNNNVVPLVNGLQLNGLILGQILAAIATKQGGDPNFVFNVPPTLTQSLDAVKAAASVYDVASKRQVSEDPAKIPDVIPGPDGLALMERRVREHRAELDSTFRGIGTSFAAFGANVDEILAQEALLPEAQAAFGMLRKNMEMIQFYLTEGPELADLPTKRRAPMDVTDVYTKVLEPKIEEARRLFSLGNTMFELVPYDETAPLFQIRASDIALRAVFRILLHNSAREFENRLQGPNVASVTVRLSDDREWVQFRVQDNGGGMTPEIRDRVFRGRFTSRPAAGGTGAGLFLTNKILEAHGGRIDVETTEVGVGTTILVEIPPLSVQMRQTPEPPATQITEAAPGGVTDVTPQPPTTDGTTGQSLGMTRRELLRGLGAAAALTALSNLPAAGQEPAKPAALPGTNLLTQINFIRIDAAKVKHDKRAGTLEFIGKEDDFILGDIPPTNLEKQPVLRLTVNSTAATTMKIEALRTVEGGAILGKKGEEFPKITIDLPNTDGKDQVVEIDLSKFFLEGDKTARRIAISNWTGAVTIKDARFTSGLPAGVPANAQRTSNPDFYYVIEKNVRRDSDLGPSLAKGDSLTLYQKVGERFVAVPVVKPDAKVVVTPAVDVSRDGKQVIYGIKKLEPTGPETQRVRPLGIVASTVVQAIAKPEQQIKITGQELKSARLMETDDKRAVANLETVSKREGKEVVATQLVDLQAFLQLPATSHATFFYGIETTKTDDRSKKPTEQTLALYQLTDTGIKRTLIVKPADKALVLPKVDVSPDGRSVVYAKGTAPEGQYRYTILRNFSLIAQRIDDPARSVVISAPAPGAVDPAVNSITFAFANLRYFAVVETQMKETEKTPAKISRSVIDLETMKQLKQTPSNKDFYYGIDKNIAKAEDVVKAEKGDVLTFYEITKTGISVYPAVAETERAFVSDLADISPEGTVVTFEKKYLARDTKKNVDYTASAVIVQRVEGVGEKTTLMDLGNLSGIKYAMVQNKPAVTLTLRKPGERPVTRTVPLDFLLENVLLDLKLTPGGTIKHDHNPKTGTIRFEKSGGWVIGDIRPADIRKNSQLEIIVTADAAATLNLELINAAGAPLVGTPANKKTAIDIPHNDGKPQVITIDLTKRLQPAPAGAPAIAARIALSDPSQNLQIRSIRFTAPKVEGKSLGAGDEEALSYFLTRDRNLEAVIQISLTHDRGGLTEGIVYVPDSPAVRAWLINRIGLDAPAVTAVNPAIQAFNAGTLNLGLESAPSDRSIPIILRSVLAAANRTEAAKIVADLTAIVKPGDLLLYLKDEAGTDLVLHEMHKGKLNVRAVPAAVATDGRIASMTKDFKAPAALITLDRAETLELTLPGGLKIKITKQVLDQGLDPMKIIALAADLIRQIPDGLEERKAFLGKLDQAFGPQQGGYWVVDNRFVEFLNKLYTEQSVQRAREIAA